jgi:hypothetical protein
MNLSWLAEIVFFTSYFIAWVTNELVHLLWTDVTAIAAIVIAVLLLVYNGRPYFDNRNHPVA